MQLLKILSKEHFNFTRFIGCYSASIDKYVVIASAARTPIGLLQGKLKTLSAQRLGAIAIEASLQRAGCPKKDVDGIYMGNTSTEIDDIVYQATKLSGLSNYILCSTINNDCFSGIQSIIEGAKFVMEDNASEVIITGGMESMSNKKNLFIEEKILEDYALFKNVFSTNNLSDQIEPIKFRNKGLFLDISEDEVLENETDYAKAAYKDGGCALILMTAKKAEELKCKPLAKILEYTDNQDGTDKVSVSQNAINKLLLNAKINKSQVSRWQLNSLTTESFDETFLDKIHINGNFGGLAGAHYVTNLAHILDENKLGCVLISTEYRAMAILLEKLSNNLPLENRLPVITVYTKETCPLCDELIYELECNFNGKYELKKVFIDDNDNYKYFELYKYDVPVVFFNAQYLCKHRLNKNLLKQKLIKLNLK